ncbi:MAG TPA: PQQ-binding-like beta-propeller repeat protein [Planctomycetota bacterium]|nr:PQQ-binding-like beta-propeller repeat protein [Planctomycetota bacterium]
MADDCSIRLAMMSAPSGRNNLPVAVGRPQLARGVATRSRAPSIASRAMSARIALVLSFAAASTPGLFSTAAAQQNEPRVQWKYAPKDSQFEGVLVSDGAVFGLDRAGAIHAIDAASGERRWTTGKLGLTYGYGMVLAKASGCDALLVGTDTGFFAFDRATGKQLWFTPIDAGVAGPACSDTAVIAGSADGNVYACELKTGRILWHHDYVEDRPDDPPGFDGSRARFGGKPARPGAAAVDGKVMALSIFDQCRAIALDVATGKRLWDFRTEGWMYGQPEFGPLHVFVGSQDKNFYAVDRDLGKLAWKVPTALRVEAGSTVVDRFVYFGSCDGNLYAVDQGVGRVAWKFMTETNERGGAPIYSRPLVRGDAVYLAAMNGTVYAVDRKQGQLLWRIAPLAKSQLVSELVTDGELLFVTTRRHNDDGESAVVAIKLP